MQSISVIPEALRVHIDAVNAHDTDAVVASFSPDAMVNDARREFVGTEAIRGWVAAEITGDRVTYEVAEALDHQGTTILRLLTDGEYDKTNLPDPLILSAYATTSEAGISSLIMVLNQPA